MSDPMRIVMDEDDFSYLTENSMNWAGHDWDTQVQAGRFEVQGTPRVPPGLHWRMAYWVGSQYTAVILARSFLTSRGFESQAVVDGMGADWVILTDYDAWKADR